MAKTNAHGLARHVAILRIIFGLMWAIDAAFKWQPSFGDGFLDQIKSAGDGQPAWLQPWFTFWANFFAPHAQLFALIVAVIETLIALALIFGVLRRVVYIGAAVFSMFIWAIPEGFGGPYSSISTDIGVGVVYAVVFLSLYGLERMAVPSIWSVDNYVAQRLPWWAVVANPSPVRSTKDDA